MRIGISGGAGFIGSNLIQMLLKEYPDFTLHNIDAITYAANKLNLDKRVNNHYPIDIADKPRLFELLYRIKPDIILHLAAESMVDKAIKSSSRFISTNIIGTTNLLDYCREQPETLICVTSTDEVGGSLGIAELPFDESAPLNPKNPYAATKAAAECMVNAYHNTYGVKSIITRGSNNYGPRQHNEKLIPKIIVNALFDREIPVYDKGEQIRDWINVEDHCRGIISAALNGKVGEIYCFGGGWEMRNIDLVKYILKIMGKPETLIKYVEDRPGHDFRYSMDYYKAEKKLGWKPQVEFNEGIKNTIEWYKQALDTNWFEGFKREELIGNGYW